MLGSSGEGQLPAVCPASVQDHTTASDEVRSRRHPLKHPVGRLPHELRRYFGSFSYEGQSWRKEEAKARRRRLQPARYGSAMDQRG